MKIQQLLNAYPIMQKLITLKLPVKKAHKVFLMARKAEEQKEFFVQEERKLIEKYEADIKEDGRIYFKDSESKDAFLAEDTELGQIEIDDFDPIYLTYDDMGDETFTAADIAALDGVVIFVDAEVQS
jgi:hypothetical protein